VFIKVHEALYWLWAGTTVQSSGVLLIRVQRVSEPQSSVAPSARSGNCPLGVRVAVGSGAGVADATNPKGVSVAVAVSVGSGVIVGKVVIVMKGVCVVNRREMVAVTVGATTGLTFVGASAGEGDAVTEPGTGGLAEQADTTSTKAIAIKSRVRAMFIIQPGEQNANSALSLGNYRTTVSVSVTRQNLVVPENKAQRVL
jgi:hypothetical protein